MNKQRKVLITITYNEMGIIVDTKAEEVAQPNLQQTCNQLATDTVSRQAAIDELVRWGKIPDYSDKEKNLIGAVIGMLSSLPSTQPERKKGKWIKATGMMPPEFHGHHCCSECGNFANMEPPFGNREDLSKFCPNCGADMRGKEE